MHIYCTVEEAFPEEPPSVIAYYNQVFGFYVIPKTKGKDVSQYPPIIEIPAPPMNFDYDEETINGFFERFFLLHWKWVVEVRFVTAHCA